MSNNGIQRRSCNIVFTGINQVEVRIEATAPVGPEQILLQTITSMISTGTECRFLGGYSNGPVTFPFYPGYSNVSQVIEVGDEVKWFKPGDRVYVIAGHKQFNVMDAASDEIVALPDGADDEDGAWAALAFITQTAVRRAKHTMGDTAVVIGQGPIGQLVTQYLNLIGTREVLVVDMDEHRLEMSHRHGATGAFRGKAIDAFDFVRTHTASRLADVVYEVSGHTDVFPQALKLVKDFGTCVLVSGVDDATKWRLADDIQKRQLTIVGTYNHKLPPEQSFWTREQQIKLFLEYIQRGKMDVKSLITHRFKPEQAPQAYELLLNQREKTCGVLFDWRHL
jgi:2-desacetyl-2-hydroxyethyl bacteriochlorophyllide A dehydrogenase